MKNLLLSLLFSAITLSAYPDEPVFRMAPYLQDVSYTEATIMWMTNVPVYGWVEYGTDTLSLQKVHLLDDGIVISNNKQHKIWLEELNPGTTYYYRACSQEILKYGPYGKEFGRTEKSPFIAFTLPYPGIKDFTCLIFNDTHSNAELFTNLVKVVENVDFDFTFFNGDVSNDPANEADAVNILSVYNKAVNAGSKPAIYIRGNHEIRGAYSMLLKKHFDRPGGKFYSAFDWGTTRFVIMDCGEDKPDSTWVYYGLNDFSAFRQEQAEWLKSEIMSKAWKKAEARVLLHHIPTFGNSDNYNPCLELWGPILKKAPFHIAINGHTHEFAFHEKGNIDNPYPVVVGGGSNAKSATVMVLKRTGKKMNLKVFNIEGRELLNINFAPPIRKLFPEINNSV